METIIVTGGLGYIGSQTILELLRNTTYNIIAIDNLCNSSIGTLERIQSITNKKITHYSIDLCEYEKLKKVFESHTGITGVIHFAALKSVPQSVEKPMLYYHNNMESLFNIVRCCSEYQVRNFIFSSSCSVYGDVASLPVSEETALTPVLSPYAHTKLLGEQFIKTVVEKFDISFAVLRYFNPVGADLTGKNGEEQHAAPGNLVPIVTQTAAGLREKMFVYGNTYNTRDGSCIRDYVHVIDIADAHIKAFEYLKKTDQKYNLFNLGSGAGVTVFEIISSFEKVSGVKVKYEITGKRAGDVEAIYSNSKKAKSLLNWEPKYSIDDMMKSAWEWQLYCLEKNKA